MYVRNTTNTNVLVHELYHSCQKQPDSQHGYDHNEKTAKRIELLWENQ